MGVSFTVHQLRIVSAAKIVSRFDVWVVGR